MQSGCAICQDLFDAAVGIVATKCGHVFHNSCIDKWLACSGTCPECRSKVCKKSLTKLYFNFSFNDKSDNDVGKSLDALKKQLHEKDLEIKEKDKKIKELQTECARTEKENEKVHQKLLEFQSELNVVKREMKTLGRVEARNRKLFIENNTLQSELEHLNNIKTIVEGSSNDAKQILTSIQGHIVCKEGKVAADKIATYCSVIKRELSRTITEKNFLQNELTILKRKMGFLQAESEKKVIQLEQQVKMSDNLDFALSEKEYGGPDAIPTSLSNNHNNEHENFDNSLLPMESPISIDCLKNKKRKMNVIVMDKHPKCANFERKRKTPASKLASSSLHARRNPGNEDSVSRVGYNGLGGHGRTIIGTKKVRSINRKRN